MAVSTTRDRTRIGQSAYYAIAIKLSADPNYTTLYADQFRNVKLSINPIGQQIAGQHVPASVYAEYSFETTQATGSDITDWLTAINSNVDIRFFRRMRVGDSSYETRTFTNVRLTWKHIEDQGASALIEVKGTYQATDTSGVYSTGTP